MLASRSSKPSQGGLDDVESSTPTENFELVSYQPPAPRYCKDCGQKLRRDSCRSSCVRCSRKNYKLPSPKTWRNQRVSKEVLDRCRKDPAWEARNELFDRIICRICGQMLGQHLTSHLKRKHRVASSDYQRQFPGVLLCTLKFAVNGGGRVNRSKTNRSKATVEEYAAKRANLFLAPEQLEECRKNPRYEIEHNLGVVCRECGFTSTWRLTNEHLRFHGLDTLTYKVRYGRDVTLSCSTLKARHRARRIGYIPSVEPLITLAACLDLRGVKLYAMRDDLFSDVKRSTPTKEREARVDRVKKLFVRSAPEIGRERERLAALSQGGREREERRARRNLPKLSA